MKRLGALLLVLCLLLAGCGKNVAAGRYEAFSEALRARNDLSFTAEVRAEYPERSARFTLAYADEDPGCSLTVTEPEAIRGVTVHLNGAESALGYDSVILDTGPLDRCGLSPVTAVEKLAGALREGHLESAWEEDGCTVWELIADDGLTVRVFLNENLIPVRAELISEGRVTVFCDILDWK